MSRPIPRLVLPVVFLLLSTAVLFAQPDMTVNWGTFGKARLALPAKKGACYTLRIPDAKTTTGLAKDNLPKILQLNPGWNYSWGWKLVDLQPKTLSFMPMFWSKGGISKAQDGTWTHIGREELMGHIKSGQVRYLLGFNEPDKKEQGNIPYQEAIDYWPLLESFGVPLCSPSCANPEGINDDSVQGVEGTWMRDFVREADKRKYRMDYIGVHFYGSANVEAFKDKMRRIFVKYGNRPLLITEFAVADWNAKSPEKNRWTPAKVLAFAKEALPWLESQEWIAGYAWFPFGIDSKPGTASALDRPDGSLTALGRYYRSITPANPAGDQTIQPDAPHVAAP